MLKWLVKMFMLVLEPFSIFNRESLAEKDTFDNLPATKLAGHAHLDKAWTLHDPTGPSMEFPWSYAGWPDTVIPGCPNTVKSMFVHRRFLQFWKVCKNGQYDVRLSLHRIDRRWTWTFAALWSLELGHDVMEQSDSGQPGGQPRGRARCRRAFMVVIRWLWRLIYLFFCHVFFFFSFINLILTLKSFKV